MGATTFACTAFGEDAATAFRNAREDAQYEHGHGGYSGTIAEKSSYKLVTLSEEIMSNRSLFDQKIDELIDTRFEDKWGPAGAVKLSEGKYYFFGWASE